MKLKNFLLAILFSFLVLFIGNNEANAAYSIEIQEAYYRALSKSITTLAPIDAAGVDWIMTRQALAKVISNFSINVLGRSPDTSKKCHFVDDDISDGLLPHVITSCQLWLMWQWIDRFNPLSVVTRAEFWTILSRILWWDKYDQWKRHTFYEKHLEALNEAWIMKDVDPTMIEVRWYVFIMLMRTSNMLKEQQAKEATERAAKNTTWTVSTQTWAISSWDVLSWTINTWSTITGAVNSGSVSTGVVQPSKPRVFTINTWATATWDDKWAWNTAEEVKEEEKKQPISYTFKVEETPINNTDKQKIYWKVYKPNRKGKMPLVIFSHWLWSNYESWIPYAEALAKSWIAVYLFDFRWWWTKSLSDWATTGMSLLTEKNDLESVLNQAKKWNYVDTNNIFLWWASQWWAVSALVASSHSDIKWSILFFPAFNIPETVKRMYASPDDIPETYGLMSMVVWKKYATDIWDLDLYKEIEKDEKPVLIVHWTADPIVNISYSEKADSIYKNSTFRKIQWWYHWFSWNQFEESVRYIQEFLEDLGVL